MEPELSSHGLEVLASLNSRQHVDSCVASRGIAPWVDRKGPDRPARKRADRKLGEARVEVMLRPGSGPAFLAAPCLGNDHRCELAGLAVNLDLAASEGGVKCGL